MTKLFEDIANLDRLIHEPARLAILTALSACESADFTFLRRLTGMTAGNLSSHIGKLEENGYVIVEKAFVDNRPNTTVKISETGLKAVNLHWQQLKALWEQSGKINLNNQSDG